MNAPELKPCPFCGGEASAVPDPNHSTGWEIGCFSNFCDVEPNVWALHKSTAEMQWNTRTDIHAAVVAERDALRAALEKSANKCCDRCQNVAREARAALFFLADIANNLKAPPHLTAPPDQL